MNERHLLTWLEHLIADAHHDRDQLDVNDHDWDYFDGKAEAYDLLRAALAGEIEIPDWITGPDVPQVSWDQYLQSRPTEPPPLIV